MKPFLEHFCFWRQIGDEMRFSVVKFFPLFIALVLPVVYPFFISLTYVNQSVVERKAVVLDMDNSAISRDLILSMDATQGLNITRTVNEIDDGVQAVMSRDADAFILIPQDFSSKIKHYEQGNLKLYIYATNMMIYAAAMTAVQETVLSKNVEIAIDQITNPAGIPADIGQKTLDPIGYQKHILYSPTLAYSTYITPLLFTLVFHQLGILILSFSIGLHRELDPEFAKKRLWFVDYFWRYLWYLALIFLGTIVVYHVICPVFGWRYGSGSDMQKLIMLMTVCHIPVTAAFSSFCRDRYTSFQVLLGSTLFFFTVSGYVWPHFAMPAWVQGVSEYLQITPAAQAFTKIAFKGLEFSDCGAEIVKMIRLGAVYLVGSIIVIHRDIWLKPIGWCVKKFRSRQNADKETCGL